MGNKFNSKKGVVLLIIVLVALLSLDYVQYPFSDEDSDLTGEAYSDFSADYRNNQLPRGSNQKEETVDVRTLSRQSRSETSINTRIQDYLLAKECAQKMCADDDSDSFNDHGDQYTASVSFFMNDEGVCEKRVDSCFDANNVIEYSCKEFFSLFNMFKMRSGQDDAKGLNLDKFPPNKKLYCQHGCVDGACLKSPVKATCSDNICNQNEDCVFGITNTPDCGGVCPKCATCNDGVQNQGELGIDCGPVCGNSCASCDDNIHNQDEYLVDCGGSYCPDCSQDKIDQCSNEIKDGNEQGVDCGGECPVCDEDKPEIYDDICFNNKWDFGLEEKKDCGGICPPCAVIDPTCSDGIQNGFEEDIDCGGPQCPECFAPGEGCIDSDNSNEENGWAAGEPGEVTYEENGQTKGPEQDECITEDYLKEFICQNQEKKEVFIPCELGCQDNPNGPDFCVDNVICVDPDAGAGVIDYVVGTIPLYIEDATTVTQSIFGGEVIAQSTDECISDTHLKEKYCDGNMIAEKAPFDCTQKFGGSVFGKQAYDQCADLGFGGFCCVNKDPECTDSDEGFNIYENGWAKIPIMCDGTGGDYGKDICGVSYTTITQENGELIEGFEGVNYEIFGDYVKEHTCNGLAVEEEWVKCPQGEGCYQGKCIEYSCIDPDKIQPPGKQPKNVPSAVTGFMFQDPNFYFLDQDLIKLVPIDEFTPGDDIPELFKIYHKDYGTFKDKCVIETTTTEDAYGIKTTKETSYLYEAECGIFGQSSATPYVTAIGQEATVKYESPNMFATYKKHLCKNCVETDEGAYCAD